MSDKCSVVNFVCAGYDAVDGRYAEFGAHVRRAVFVDLHRLRPVLRRVARDPTSITTSRNSAKYVRDCLLIRQSVPFYEERGT